MSLLSLSPLILLVGGIWAIAAAFVVTANVGDKSWTGGDFVAAIAAFAVAAIVLAVVIAQVVKRGWKRLSFAFNLLLLVSLALVGTGGIVFKAQAGIVQAQHFAAAGDWADALKVYTMLANDPACGQDCQHTVASDTAHAHYEYGYQLETAHNYQAAISQFEASLTAAPSGSDTVPAHVELSHAHYSYGLQFVTQKYYLEAISEFEQAVNAAPSGPYARQAHLATATAYYVVAQQDLSASSCQEAVLALQTIVKQYADAPEAKQAATDLAAPVKVMGTLTDYPVNPTPQVWLSTKAHAPHCCAPAAPGTYSFSGDYKTTVDPKTGGYVFAHVPPGMYTLSTFRQVGSSWDMTWWYASNESDLFFLQVGPICTVTWPILSCKGLCR